MENQNTLIKSPQYDVNFKKINNHSIINFKRIKMKKKEDIVNYDEIISRAKNTIDSFQKQLEETIPSITNYGSKINNIKNIKNSKNIKSYLNIHQPSYNKKRERTTRVLSGSSLYFQPILTDITNSSKDQISRKIITENSYDNINDNYNNIHTDEYYKKLYRKSKNENIKLIKRISELENINKKNEKIIIDYKNEKNFLIKKIEDLQNIINEYENKNNYNYNNITHNNQDIKYDFNIKNNNGYIILNN